MLYAAVWIAALVSGPLTLAQQRLLGFAVQVSVPVFLLATLYAYRLLIEPTAMPAQRASIH